MENIFDRFHQVKRISSDNDSGSGLGLTIVKKILEMHGISIEVKSQLEKGTSFSLFFPLVQIKK